MLEPDISVTVLFGKGEKMWELATRKNIYIYIHKTEIDNIY